jgi:hypothetical protein
MRPAVVVLGLVSCFGCGFKSPAVGDGSLDDMPMLDGALDASPDAVAGDDLLLVGTVTYDTGSHVLKVNNVPTTAMHMTVTLGADSFDAIVAHDVHLLIGTSLKATGGAPLVIVAQNNITIDASASIDVSDGGAGMLPNCSTPPGVGSDDDNGGGGGGGGGFIGAGGHGGSGHNNNVAGGTGAASISPNSGLQGGCPGGRAGTGSMGSGGAPGRGGGAIYLEAGNSITLAANAQLVANGAGGHGGPAGNNGGGGGGSGGMLWLKASHIIAPLVSPSARLIANGGSGGGGGSDAAGTDGNVGMTAAPAIGGSGATDCSAGGNGGSRNATSGGDVIVSVKTAGGGGGGGVGMILLMSADAQVQGATISPAPS